MVDTVARLQTVIEADNRPFKKAIKEAEQSVKTFTSSMSTNLTTAVKAIALLTSGFTALVGIANQGVTRMGKIADVASDLGIAGSKLRELQLAAGEAGVGAEQLNSSLSKMQATLGQVGATGKGKAADVLKQLNLNFNDLKRLSPEQQYLKIADGISKLNTQADKAYAKKVLLGNGVGVGFVTSDISGTIADYKALGAVLDDEVIAKLDKLDDTRGKLGSLFTGFGDQLAGALADPMQQFYDYIIQSIKEFGGLKTIAQQVADVMRTAAGFVGTLGQGIGVVVRAAQGLGETLAKLKIASEDKNSVSGKINSGLDAIDNYVGSKFANGSSNIDKYFQKAGINTTNRQFYNPTLTSSIPGTPMFNNYASQAANQPDMASIQISAVASAAKQASQELNQLGAAAGNVKSNVFNTGPAGFSDLVAKINGGAAPTVAVDPDFENKAVDVLTRFRKQGNNSLVQSDLGSLEQYAKSNAAFGDNAAMLEVVKQLKEYVDPGSTNKPKVQLEIDTAPDLVVKHLKTKQGEDVLVAFNNKFVSDEARKVGR